MNSTAPRPGDSLRPRLSAEQVESRVAQLKLELAASSEPERKAVLQYEIGVLIETALGNEAGAVQEYLSAYNHDHGFRPPLFALLRLFERRRSVKNLARLYDAEARSASSSDDRASALVDRGTLLEDHLGEVAGARSYYEQAATESPAYLAASLMLERAAFASGDKAGALASIASRAEHARDPVLRSLLFVEVAWAREALGAVEDGIALLRRAVDLPAGKLRSLEQLERMARKHSRASDLVFALEERARLIRAATRGADEGQGSGAFAVDRFAQETQATLEAAALEFEAAQERLAHGDAEGAAAALSRAIEIVPDDTLLRHERMLALELVGDLEGASADAQFLLQRRFPGAFSASLHFRASELALSRDDVDTAREAMTQASLIDPGSATARAMLDDLLVDTGNQNERIERLTRDTDGVSAAAKTQAYFRGGQIAVEQLGDFERGEKLYRAAIAQADPDNRVRIERELYAAARRHGAHAVALEMANVLLGRELDEVERGQIAYDRYLLLRDSLANERGADDAIKAAVEDPACASWALDVARVRAAKAGDYALLAQAHEAIADRATDDETTASHLAAAARARARAKQDEAAIALLRRALERVPGHRYVVALLEEILRSRGDSEGVVKLLREAAAADLGAKGAETSLLLAGAAAEAANDPKAAEQTYEEAADRDPTSVAPLWALRRLAERTGDDKLHLRALEALSEREIVLGEPGRATIDLGEHYDLLSKKPELAEAPLRAALDSEYGGLAAAVSLLLLPRKNVDPGTRLAALERLVDAAPEGKKPLLERLLGGEAARVPEQRERAAKAIAVALEASPNDVWASYTETRLAGTEPGHAVDRANAWVALGRATSDEAASGDILLHGLRTMMFAGEEGAGDDAFILAQEITEIARGGSAAAIAIDETLAGGDDAEARAEALAARLEHAGREGKLSLESALGRALSAAQQSAEAVNVLKRVVAADENDLAAWDALRVAGRAARSYADVVEACDRLAARTSGDLKAELLEEAAALLMDEIGDDPGAESRLRAALEVDVTRPNAYGRLRDLLAERGDTAAMMALSDRRVIVDRDPRELEKIYYEQARVLRSEADRKGALNVLDKLLELSPSHVGGLALAVEIHVAREEWARAVERLRVLASADVPVSQKRIARLGAADFLEKRLDDPRGALVELGHVAQLGHGDVALHLRMADIAERAGFYDDAVAALERAAAQASDEERAKIERRAGAIHAQNRGDPEAAIAAYERALDEVPDDVEAGEALAELLSDPEARAAMSEDFENAVRIDLDDDPTDPRAIRKLRRAAVWRNDRDMERAATGLLVALGAATPEESETHAKLFATVKGTPIAGLAPESLHALRAAGNTERPRDLARLVENTLIDAMGTSPFLDSKPEQVRERDESPLRDELTSLAFAVGLEKPFELWISPKKDRSITFTYRKENLALVVGGDLRAPLTAAQRFVVGRLAFAVVDGALPFVTSLPSEGEALLRAAAIVGETPIDGEDTDASSFVPAVSKAMPRRVRKAIPPIANGMTRDELAKFLKGARASASRAGVLLSGDVKASLEELLAEKPSREAILDTPEAFALVSFWLSASCSALRRALGVAA